MIQTFFKTNQTVSYIFVSRVLYHQKAGLQKIDISRLWTRKR